ncbi:MAG: hypothetical protein WEB58_22395 [Planctomycetaceae bacterium]
MRSLDLPDDLSSFLKDRRQVDYDPKKCEAGVISFHPLDQLRLQYFPVFSQNLDGDTAPDDPHADELGCYLVQGVSLIASCDDYEPIGLLNWMPIEKQYGIWDASHNGLVLLGSDVTWTQIARDLPRYINAGWNLKGSAPTTAIRPWEKHPFNGEQVFEPLDVFDEWYEASLVRFGERRNDIQIRHAEEILIRIERDGDWCEAALRRKKTEENAEWTDPQRRSLDSHEWLEIQPLLETGFWNQPSSINEYLQIDTETNSKFLRWWRRRKLLIQNSRSTTAFTWRCQGLRGGTYHILDQSYKKGSDRDDSILELARRLAKVMEFEQIDEWMK